jgi:hypothetical protein
MKKICFVLFFSLLTAIMPIDAMDLVAPENQWTLGSLGGIAGKIGCFKSACCACVSKQVAFVKELEIMQAFIDGFVVNSELSLAGCTDLIDKKSSIDDSVRTKCDQLLGSIKDELILFDQEIAEKIKDIKIDQNKKDFFKDEDKIETMCVWLNDCVARSQKVQKKIYEIIAFVSGNHTADNSINGDQSIFSKPVTALLSFGGGFIVATGIITVGLWVWKKYKKNKLSLS